MTDQEWTDQLAELRDGFNQIMGLPPKAYPIGNDVMAIAKYCEEITRQTPENN